MLTEAMMLTFATLVAKMFELAGISVVIIGTLFALARFGRGLIGGRQTHDETVPDDLVATFRKTLGRSILIGLEFLVAADIIRTVAIEPTLQSVLVLGLIVLIRTFLSFSLEVEIDGRWPWQGHKANREK